MSQWWQYTSVVFFKAWTELRTETAKTYVGVLWWILDPILYMAVFYVVFSQWRQRDEGDFIQFLLIALVFFRWFSNSVSNASTSIVQARGLMQQLYLPKIVFPLVSFVKNCFKFLITFVLLLGFLWVSGMTPTESYLALPGVMLIQIILTLGVLLLTAAVVPLLPDLKFLIGHVMTALLFLSGTFYSGADLSPEHQRIFYLNPVACLIESYREILLYQRLPNWDLLWKALIGGSLFLTAGLGLVIGLDRRYPRIVKAR
ncbi:MAG: ABC transporter permease [Pseudomonadota bacterium]